MHFDTFWEVVGAAVVEQLRCRAMIIDVCLMAREIRPRPQNERLESVRIGKCQNAFFFKIGKCQNRKVSELESARIGKCQNWKVSELESVRIGKCQNLKVSELESVRIF